MEYIVSTPTGLGDVLTLMPEDYLNSPYVYDVLDFNQPMRTSLRAATALLVVLLSLLLSLQLPHLQQMAATLAARFLSPTTTRTVNKILLPNSRLSSLVSQFQQAPSRPFTSTTITMAPSSDAFFEAVKARRTIYQLANESTIPDSRIQELVKGAVLHTPSSFNSQTTRMVVLLKEAHTKMWDITTEVYKQQLPEDKFKHAKGRFDGFRAAYGTVSQGLEFLWGKGWDADGGCV